MLCKYILIAIWLLYIYTDIYIPIIGTDFFIHCLNSLVWIEHRWMSAIFRFALFFGLRQQKHSYTNNTKTNSIKLNETEDAFINAKISKRKIYKTYNLLPENTGQKIKLRYTTYTKHDSKLSKMNSEITYLIQ